MVLRKNIISNLSSTCRACAISEICFSKTFESSLGATVAGAGLSVHWDSCNIVMYIFLTFLLLLITVNYCL